MDRKRLNLYSKDNGMGMEELHWGTKRIITSNYSHLVGSDSPKAVTKSSEGKVLSSNIRTEGT